MVGTKIRELRRKRNLIQSELGRLLSVHPSTIAMWENGKRQPEREKLVQISKLFNVTMDWLLSDDAEKSIEIKIPTTENTITIMGRNGTHKTYIVNDSQIKALQTFADTLIKKNGDQ